MIGYGSDLRTDDAAGRHVATAVAAAGPDGVEVRSLVQLTPEVAAELTGRRLVVFVDAAVDVSEVRVEHLDPVDVAPVTTHHVDPRGLLALCRLLGDPPAEVVCVSIPAHDLRIGTALTEATRRGVAEAAGRVLDLVSPRREDGPGPPGPRSPRPRPAPTT